MPAIQHLLQRWGFVQLRRYGLELTSDGRVLSTRPAVLDDGTGGRIVGWQDGDVAIWKLSRWSGGAGVGSQGPSGVIAPPAVPPPARPAPVTPTIPAGSEAQAAWVAAPSRASARVIPAEVAGEVPVDEDDWEWTIALARARVAVEEAEVARPPAVAFRPELPAHRPPERPTLRSSATADLAASGDWRRTDTTRAAAGPTTETQPGAARETVIETAREAIEAARETAIKAMHEATRETTVESAAYEDYRVSTRPAIQIPHVVPAVAIPRATTPSTVIPVPSLPTVDATRRARLEPVVRVAPATTLVNRFAKGTGPVDPPALPRTRQAALILDETAALSVGDRTTPGFAPATRRTTAVPASELDDGLGEPVAPPAPSAPPSGDRTRPGIALPVAARTVSLPSIKRRTAR